LTEGFPREVGHVASDPVRQRQQMLAIVFTFAVGHNNLAFHIRVRSPNPSARYRHCAPPTDRGALPQCPVRCPPGGAQPGRLPSASSLEEVECKCHARGGTSPRQREGAGHRTARVPEAGRQRSEVNKEPTGCNPWAPC